MKVDPRNPMHWYYLAASAAWVLLAIMLRPLRRLRRGRSRVVLLYGHKLGGNLLAIQQRLHSHAPATRVAFLTLDPDYHHGLSASGESSVCAVSPGVVRWLIEADAVISDHGLHTLLPLRFLSSLRFFDVWHGIPFKGFDAEDFRVQQRYDETWVASPLLQRMYVERFGFRPERVAVTGYARTDRLVRRDEDVAALRGRVGAPPDGPLVLFAPTWAQDSAHRSIYPFGCSEDEFLGALSSMAGHCGATILLRVHLNSNAVSRRSHPNIIAVPYSQYPDTEGILQMADVLVCDWSSIAFDFLLLDRPTVFLDVPAPFRKGFSLGPEYRFGAVEGDLPGLLRQLERCLRAPADYWAQQRSRHDAVREQIYGEFADGNAAARCVDRISPRVSP